MLLQDLIDRRNQSKQEFLEGRPSACLLFDPFAGSRPHSIDTPDQPFNFRDTVDQTEILSAARIAHELIRGAEEASQADPKSELQWLDKTARNPFANLITVGRAGNNDLVLEHTSVSKLHATFSQIGDQWYLADSSSKNGTFLNGVLLAPQAKRELNSGDRIGFGGEISARFLPGTDLWDLVCSMRDS